MVTVWLLKCEECGSEWELEVSFNLKDVPRLYHYCKVCRRNTFHKVLGVLER